MIQSLEFNYNVTFNYDLANSLCIHTIDSLTKKTPCDECEYSVYLLTDLIDHIGQYVLGTVDRLDLICRPVI